MNAHLSVIEQERVAASRRRKRARLSTGDVWAELIIGGAFAAAAVILWALVPPARFSPSAMVWSTVTMVLAMRVWFETPLGFAPVTQLAFIPLLFGTPIALVPVMVVTSVVASLIPDVAAGRLHVHKLLPALGHSWFCIGPCFVFAIAGVTPRVAGPALLLGALGAQFAGDFVAGSLRCRIARGASWRSQLGESWVYIIDAALSGIGLVVAKQTTHSPYAVLAVIPLLGVLAMFAHERQGRLTSLLELNETYRGTALLLGDVIAADDGYTGEHSQGVVGLAMAVGAELGLDAERSRNLEFGALLHDVGKICVPKEIINKPGKLDPHEWEIIKTHAAEGERMLRQVGGFMRDVGRIVRSHHERWDGGGYPDGIAAEAIPLESRIITCCDSWNAMRTDRPYRAAMSYEIATQELQDHSGTQFDPAVVAALMQVVGRETSPAPREPALSAS